MKNLRKGETTRPIDTADVSHWDSENDQDARQELCVVIAFHPETSRIGELCQIACTDESITIGRHLPEFSSPEDSQARGEVKTKGIADQYVSRQAVSLQRQGNDWCLCRSPGRSRLRVNANELPAKQRFSEDQLRQGLIISLAQRVVLHLRLQVPQSSPQDMPTALAPLKGVSPALQQLRESTMAAARTSSDVLLIGPTGSGKERVARAIHMLSCRSEGPWVAVNMAATPVDIASASLFGARKGAYTGADSNRSGFFQQADGGTLFLDEVADTPETLQPMLLRALQEREIQVVGGKSERVDLRVIAAMEQDPDELRERFRPALRYRLGAQEIRLPALARRREDIAVIAADLFEDCAQSQGRAWIVGDEETTVRSWARLFEQLLIYSWPGNVRELQHTVAQISAGSAPDLRVPPTVKARLAGACDTAEVPKGYGPATYVKEVPPVRLADVSDEDFTAAWKSAKYEVTTVARQLGVSRSAIYRRLENLRECRLAADVPLGEMLSVLDDCRGDLVATADRLAVSWRGLQTRLRASGVSAADRLKLSDH